MEEKNMRDFVQDAIAKHGEKIGATIVTETKKGETVRTKIKTSTTGGKIQIIEVL